MTVYRETLDDFKKWTEDKNYNSTYASVVNEFKEFLEFQPKIGEVWECYRKSTNISLFLVMHDDGWRYANGRKPSSQNYIEPISKIGVRPHYVY